MALPRANDDAIHEIRQRSIETLFNERCMKRARPLDEEKLAIRVALQHSSKYVINIWMELEKGLGTYIES
jgi:hypothetical protein